METVRFGIIGLGGVGSHHLEYINLIEGVALKAICDADPRKLQQHAAKTDARPFERYQDLLNSGMVDAILIATPHYDHPLIAAEAFKKNLHVLSEKPIAVSVKAARELNEAAAGHPHLKFGVMFQQRTLPLYSKLRELIMEGELGEISRVTWIITNWFRTWSYYASGGWRATWEGEGGGVLLNQCPHNLDLIQWVVGMMPNRVTAVASIGKTHPIEVEDEVSAVLEYPNGAIGHFITTTGEAPGTNRLEICGDRGRIVAEEGKLLFKRTRKSVREVREKSPDKFSKIEKWDIDIPIKVKPEAHRNITENFVRAILKNEPLIAPGTEGVKGLELGNAMLMAGLTRTAIDLPMDGEAYDQFLKELVRKYSGRKTLKPKSEAAADTAGDMSKSFMTA